MLYRLGIYQEKVHYLSISMLILYWLGTAAPAETEYHYYIHEASTAQENYQTKTNSFMKEAYSKIYRPQIRNYPPW